MSSFNKPLYGYTLVALVCAVLLFIFFVVDSEVQRNSEHTPPEVDRNVLRNTVSENTITDQSALFRPLSGFTNETIAISLSDIVSEQPADTYVDFTTGRSVRVEEWATKRERDSVSWIGIAHFDNGPAPITITATLDGTAFASIPTEQGVFWGSGALSNMKLNKAMALRDHVKEPQVLPTERAMQRGTAVNEICVNC